MSKRVKNKVALITGAGSGIGAATAKRLAEEGASVIVTDIDEQTGKKIVNEIKEAGHKASYMQLDVTNENQWIKVYEGIKHQNGQLNILVNNVSVHFRGSIKEMPLAEWKHLLAVNMDGVFLGTKYGIPLMEKSKTGSIINVSSTSGIFGFPMTAAYCATKGGIRLFTKAVALECARSRNNIRVNSIHPGPTATESIEKSPILQQAVKKTGSLEAAHKLINSIIPLNRMARVEEIANAILYLASDESSFMTGSELIIDGGQTAGRIYDA